MTRTDERRMVIELRKQGKTYSEIRKALRIPKSTLSDWLRNFPMTKHQMEQLAVNVKKKKLLAVEKTILTKALKRKKRLKNVYLEEKKKLLPLNSQELYLCGLFLYWGEGSKSSRYGVSLNNTDPKVMSFYYYWLTNSLHILKEDVRVSLHLYDDMNIVDSIRFWSGTLGISKAQFVKPYIKKSLKKDIDQKGFGHGTCGIYVYDRNLKERIMQGIQALADYYAKKIGEEI